MEKRRNTLQIPEIKIDLAEDTDPPKDNFVRRTRRFNSAPADFLTVPTERAAKDFENKLICKNPPTKKDLTKGIGMSKILKSIEKRKIKTAQRKRRKNRFANKQPSTIENEMQL